MNTLLLLHGWGTDGRIWGRQIEAFSKKPVRVVAPAWPAWEADWLRRRLHDLPLAETVVVGWSLGGMLVLEALSREPLIPAGLVLVATPVSFCQRPDHPAGQPPALVRGLRRALRADRRRVLADFAARCLAPAETRFEEDLLPAFLDSDAGADLAAGLDYLLATDLRPRLSQAPSGAVIIQGDQDAIVPPHQAEILQGFLKEARVVNLSGAGHAPFLTRADLFNAVLLKVLAAALGVGDA